MSTTDDRDKQFLPGAEEFHSIYTERKEEFDATFDKLKDIYGAYNAGLGRVEARTYTENAFRKIQFGRLAAETPLGDEPKWEWLHTAQLPNIITTTRTIQHGLDILKEECGVDIIADRKQLSNNPALFQEADAILSVNVEYVNGFSEMSDEVMARVFAKDMLNLFGGSRHLFKQGIVNTEKAMLQMSERSSLLMASVSQQSFYKHIIDNLTGARYEAHQQLRKLVGDDVNEFIGLAERGIEGLQKNQASSEVIESILESQKQELDYTILPRGTQLEEVARQIIEDSPESEKATVDLERLAVLEEVRQLYGPENCYLMRGKKTGKEMADENGTLISEDYIGLIMQHYDDDGAVTREDCLAISPIAQKHAGYIVRQDASAGISWREILSLPKAEAIRYFNARRLRFDTVAGESKYDAYVKKTVTLLTCETEQFNSDHRLRRTKSGDYEMIFRPQNIGERVLANVQY